MSPSGIVSGTGGKGSVLGPIGVDQVDRAGQDRPDRGAGRLDGQSLDGRPCTSSVASSRRSDALHQRSFHMTSRPARIAHNIWVPRPPARAASQPDVLNLRSDFDEVFR
jgi:hypothetical protein